MTCFSDGNASTNKDLAMSSTKDAVETYIREVHGSRGGSVRVIGPEEAGRRFVDPKSSVSADVPLFSPTYYEAAIPPPSHGLPSWCIWCGKHVLTSAGTVVPPDTEEAACSCICNVCSGSRDACRENGCGGFFTDDAVRDRFHDPGNGLTGFRREARDRLIHSYKEMIGKIFEYLYQWKTARQSVPSPSSRPSAPTKSICVICHVEYFPRFGFAGLCGACRVYPQINQHLVREGGRGASSRRVRAEAKQPEPPDESEGPSRGPYRPKRGRHASLRTEPPGPPRPPAEE